MNKKFFAALASATMAFTASGSIAVFADDFVEESNVVDPGDIQQNPTKIMFTKENFGALVEDGVAKFYSDDNGGTTTEVTLTKDADETNDLKTVKTIKLQSGFEGEIKGLEYFTILEHFDDAAVTVDATHKGVTNETLDFSANTKLEGLTVNKAPELAEIKLPEPVVNEKEEKEYSLTTLDVQGTKLTSLDLSEQAELVANKTTSKITVKKNDSLKEVTLKKATSGNQAKVHTLDLSENALETVNLDNYQIANLDLSKNHIGALNLSKTTADSATLSGQTFYVYEKAANVNLKEAFADLDVDYVTAKDDATAFNSETGILDLTKDTEYKYDTKVGTATDKLVVELVLANPMNRLYNPNSGEHFYTVDVKEKEALVKLGWNDEGYGWVAPKKATDDKAVYRLYNPNAGDHHYTMSEDERDTLVAYGWKDENVGWYSAEDASHTDTIDVYRQYNPYANGAGSHNYTTDKAESNYLVSLGWIYEGKAWKALR